ncbi:MAG: hypothetical protein Q7S34_01660 [bacterium]|nr:hypothetical protein [bacterium]
MKNNPIYYFQTLPGYRTLRPEEFEEYEEFVEHNVIPKIEELSRRNACATAKASQTIVD